MTDLVWSADCAGCGRELAGPLCALCRLELLGPVGRREAAAPRLNPADGGPPLPVWSSAWYTGAVRRAVVAWKRTGRGELGREFSRAVARTAQAAAPLLGAICGQVAVVPAPSRWVRRWSRPGGGSEVLAAAVAGGLAGCGLSATVVDALVRAPLAREQAGRTSRQRQAGREGSTRVRRPQVVRPAAAGPLALAWALSAPAGQGPGAAVDLRPGAAAAGEELGAAPTGRRLWAGRRADGIGPAAPPVLLVDDVLTTGATLLDAERALARAGRATLGAVVLAVSPREARPRPEGGGLGAPDAHDGQSFD